MQPDSRIGWQFEYGQTPNLTTRQDTTPAADFPARKWGSKWMIWLQDLLATFAFFV